MKQKYESEALQVIHEDMQGMCELGIISGARMREFDELCLARELETDETGSYEQGKIAKLFPSEARG